MLVHVLVSWCPILQMRTNWNHEINNLSCCVIQKYVCKYHDIVYGLSYVEVTLASTVEAACLDVCVFVLCIEM